MSMRSLAAWRSERVIVWRWRDRSPTMRHDHKSQMESCGRWRAGRNRGGALGLRHSTRDISAFLEGGEAR
jgi:hypothetical protein